MANSISRIEIKDFLVFKGEFSADFCPGINILIGSNGCGKTTILKAIYQFYQVARSNMVECQWALPVVDKNNLANSTNPYPSLVSAEKIAVTIGGDKLSIVESGNGEIETALRDSKAVYIPEKDILEHAKGLLTFIEQKQTGFSQLYKDVLVAAMDVPTRKQTALQKSIKEKIVSIIGGTIQWDKSEGSFYTMRTDGTRIPFANEASGFKKLGYLGLLVSSGQLDNRSVLFWDEPENSLNPDLIPILVEILLELQRGGVQMFIATHSELLANKFNISRKSSDEIKFFSLYKGDDGSIKADTDTRFDLLQPNKLMQASVEQYESEVERGLGDNA